MAIITLINYLSCAEPLACLVVLAFIVKRNQLGLYNFLAAFLAVRTLSSLLLLSLVHFSRSDVGVIELHLGYKIYFYVYWISYAIEALLGFGMIYSLYKLAMEPLPGLQRLGIIMFRWAGAIALILAASLAFGPHSSSAVFLTHFVAQLQQTQSILTLCMLLFVTLASKPMGLSYRSKVVGVSLGLGVLAATDLAVSSWVSHASMLSAINILNGLAICATLLIWGTYFALPEPKRRMIVLPTTSPFLRWNQISQVLGDEPGFVVLGQMTPDMFAPAEVEIMRRASEKMAQHRLAVG